MSAYVKEFLSLKCSGDVLNVVNPLGSKAQKEITESMAIIKKMKGIFLEQPMKLNLYDLCAGNALTSVLSVFLLPVLKAYAYDVKGRNRNWENASRFKYTLSNIYKLDPSTIGPDSVIISVHPCSKLAVRVCEIFNESSAKHLFLMPCCVGSYKTSFGMPLQKKLGKYLL